MKTIMMTLFLLAATAHAADPKQALLEAVQAADVARIEALLSRDPTLASARSKRGVSAVAIAGTLNKDGEGFTCTRDNPPLRALLARAPTLDAFDAALVGDEARLTALLAADAKLVTAVHPFGWRLLHFAAFGGKLGAVKLLLARGAELDARAANEFDNTALQTALLCGEAEVVRFLLEKGADANARQDQGFVPLHEAAFLGRKDLAQLLLDHGADVNARNAKGESPVGTALRRKHPDVAAFLRAHGARD